MLDICELASFLRNNIGQGIVKKIRMEEGRLGRGKMGWS